MGSGGLGKRGSGLGGGGTAGVVGGLGIKGRGSGTAGYGKGGGTFGQRGELNSVRGSVSVGARAEVAGARDRRRAERARSPVGSEQYTNHGVNRMTLTEEDALSTFAIDVDTASYAIARRKLQSGYLPPAGAVRVEEFVNYFSYDYPSPRDERPFAVHMEAAPSPYQPGHHLLRVGVKGREQLGQQRPPVRLTFLVDVSGSMSSADKLPLAKEALEFLVGQLGVEDSVAIATYAGRVRRVLAPTPTTKRSRIYRAIDSLGAGGSTAMNSGIDLAYEMAAQAYVEGAENRVVVLSDGDANVGPASHQGILKTIAQHAGQGITLSTIGFGTGNYKDTLMEQLADKGDGNYHYCDSMAEAEKVFGKDLAGTIRTIARDVKIQVEFDPQAVLAYRLVGYENRDVADRDFRNDAVDAGEVGSGHRVTALYDLLLRDDAGEHLATVRLRAKPPGKDAAASEWFTSLTRSSLRDEFAGTSRDYRLATGAAGFADKLRGSQYMEEVGYRQVAAVVRDALRPGHAEDGELLELVERAAELVGEGQMARR